MTDSGASKRPIVLRVSVALFLVEMVGNFLLTLLVLTDMARVGMGPFNWVLALGSAFVVVTEGTLLWFAWLRRRWARYLLVAYVVVIAFISVNSALSGYSNSVELIRNALSMALQVVAAILLLLPPVNTWFQNAQSESLA